MPRFPYVPSNPSVLDERCFEIYNIQVHSLIKRLTATGIKNMIIGVSGGLDSSLIVGLLAERGQHRQEQTGHGRDGLGGSHDVLPFPRDGREAVRFRTEGQA